MLGKQGDTKKRKWRKRIKINARCIQGNKAASGMLHLTCRKIGGSKLP